MYKLAENSENSAINFILSMVGVWSTKMDYDAEKQNK